MADATAKLSGYLASAAAVTWASGQALDSLTDNEFTDLTDEIDNSSNKYLLIDWDLVLGSAAFTGTDSWIEIYVVKSVDGTNYPTWTGNGTSDEQENNPFYRDSATTTGTTAAQRMTGGPIAAPQGKFKFGFRNRGNVTLASSGNTFYWRPHGLLSDEA
jgi:hypothetical protein